MSEGIYILVFFFVKQKTAYEMRISDWSSDVCSSDLRLPRDPELTADLRHRLAVQKPSDEPQALVHHRTLLPRHRHLPTGMPVGRRSEEHTSELQSLMRISYAVFCLKKKKHHSKQL